jgi:hypothetical protein
MWIAADALPADGRMMLLDYDQFYAASVDSSGTLRCIVNQNSFSLEAISSKPLSPGRWTHIACTIDTTHVTIYVDGEQTGQQVLGIPPPIAPSTLAIASNSPALTEHYVGLIDNLRLWSVTLSPPQVCALAGRC